MQVMQLRIAHLYAHFLNIYGDRGNIIALSQRALWRGIEVKVEAIDLNQKTDPDFYDLYFVGGAEDLLKRQGDLKTATSNGAVILSVCGGYQLLGHYYKPHDGPELKGISLLDAYTVAGDRRMIGNVTIKGDDGLTLVGFENHSGKTFLGHGVPPLGKILVGNGNNGEDKTEGAALGTVYGTYLHGSLLPKNPHFADRLLTQALKRRYGEVSLAALDDKLENQAHKRALALPS
jgi:CobQ-like glutamine amidotransferase family enzyme